MASMPYPPWRSAPPTPEGRYRKKWWSNAKQAVLRPWRRRSDRRVKKRKTSASPHPYTPRTQEEQFRAVRGDPIPRFSPFVNQLNFPIMSPLNMGNVGDMQPKAFSEGYGGSSQDTTPPPTFDPGPAPYKPSRPSLSNIFPMYSTLQVAPRKLPEGQRRHSTGTTNTEQRPSVQSTESNERSLDRRERRVRAVRALPVPNVRPKRKASAPIITYQTPSSYQDSPPHINYSLDEFEPPALSPTDAFSRLKAIKEEGSDSEIKGFDEFMMY